MKILMKYPFLFSYYNNTILIYFTSIQIRYHNLSLNKIQLRNDLFKETYQLMSHLPI